MFRYQTLDEIVGVALQGAENDPQKAFDAAISLINRTAGHSEALTAELIARMLHTEIRRRIAAALGVREEVADAQA